MHIEFLRIDPRLSHEKPYSMGVCYNFSEIGMELFSCVLVNVCG
ncbi:MAG: hypothetical protein JWO64_642 [Hyphomicrobiales bacterium]|nr:hypothetical protein [Hyphomicrobiales bacterium]